MKAIPSHEILPFVELAVQREGLVIKDKFGTDDDEGLLRVSVFCTQTISLVSCMYSIELRQMVFPVKKTLQSRDSKGNSIFQSVEVISKSYSGLGTMGGIYYKLPALQEAISSQLTSFFNDWRKANPKP
jgi:hypothetical protein